MVIHSQVNLYIGKVKFVFKIKWNADDLDDADFADLIHSNQFNPCSVNYHNLEM